MSESTKRVKDIQVNMWVDSEEYLRLKKLAEKARVFNRMGQPNVSGYLRSKAFPKK